MSDSAAVPEFPVKSAIRTITIGDHTTDISLQNFSNLLFVTISQCQGQPGTLIEVRSENPIPIQRGDFAANFNFNVLFGVETQEILLAARVLAETLSQKIDTDQQSILFSLALKDTSKTTLSTLSQEVVSALQSAS